MNRDNQIIKFAYKLLKAFNKIASDVQLSKLSLILYLSALLDPYPRLLEDQHQWLDHVLCYGFGQSYDFDKEAYTEAYLKCRG